MDKIENLFNALGVVFGLANIHTILGIILLVINITILVVRYGIVIFNHIKNKNYDKAVDELDKLKDDVNKEVNKK